MEKKTSIIACGLTVHNTPVEIREKLSIPEVSACASIGCAFKHQDKDEKLPSKSHPPCSSCQRSAG